ncbi:MAG: lamin tail domain-containing protein [Verrucomicrobia bacterium]|nr:lamin tail domain-containing protein [Verrucomicrobiota bacterium]
MKRSRRGWRWVARFFMVALAVVAGCLQAETVVPLDSNWRWLKGLSEASSPDPTAWRQVGFNAGAWPEAPAPFWYGDVQPSPGTELSDMRYNYSCVFMRGEFVLENPNDIDTLTLRAASDDGFIAWINGQEVLRFNMPEGEIPYFGSSSPALGETSPWPPAEEYVLADPRDYLRQGANVLAVQAFNSSLGDSSDFVINVGLDYTRDQAAPVVVQLIPPASATVRSLGQIEVDFSEPVSGVDAADLRINGVGATNVVVFDPSVYMFEFAPAAAGEVQVVWRTGHGITDLAALPNAFAGGSWTYTVDPDLPAPGVIISEFMASNDETLNDEDGDRSDWIELRNTDAVTADLNGWYLTDSNTELTKWRIPNVSVVPDGHLVIFASGKDRSDPTRQLHTNFRLGRERGYLALVNPEGEVVSAFEPAYPEQQTDISYGRDHFAPTVVGYFPVPTPGGPNSSGGPGFSPPVHYSRPGGTFLTGFQLTRSTESPTAVIRYTLDGSVPSESSAQYRNPINVSGTVMVRARSYEAGLLPGTPRSEAYVQLASSLANFTSDLPLVILENFGAGTVPANYDQPGYLTVFEPGADGRSSLTNAPELATRVGFNIRGRSTAGMEKASYAVELWDEANEDKDMSVLGMPAESDWVLYAPNVFDHPLIHNPFIYDLSNELGRYASRSRLVELWLNTTGGAIAGPVPQGNYRGVYVLMEKVKRNADRVALERLEPEHTQAPPVTGGYLLKVASDLDGDERSFNAANLGIGYQYPDGLEMVTAQRTAQANYIRDYFNAFYAALTGQNPGNAATGYPAYIDVESWLDHHLLNVITLNVDALRLSAYFYKDREQKIEMGPIWDFDRSMGTTGGGDVRAYNPRNWRGLTWDEGTDFFNSNPAIFTNPWYGRLFQQIDFWQLYVDRYQELRQGLFSNGHVFGLVDGLADQLREAQPREASRWWDTTPRSGTVSHNGYVHTFPGTYQGEIDFLKRWLGDRLDFMDTNFLARPVASRLAGPVTAGTTVTLTGPPGATIYYTLDGTDPRAAGGAGAAGAHTYSGPITISSNRRLVARARNLSHANLTGPSRPPLSTPWSGVVAATYVVQTPPLVITELMYHPAEPPPGDAGLDAETLEYVELLNRGSAALNLSGFRFTRGIDYTFGNVVLAAGQRVVLAKDMTAYQSRYGAGGLVVGPYSGQLDNGGERLTLEGPLGEPILDFSYRDGWYPVTDGHGFSLAIVDENALLESWGMAASWRPDGVWMGSPGQSNPALPEFPAVVINEALTHTDLPRVDAIELRNLGPGEAAIGGWYLTDSFDQPRKFRIPSGTVIPAGGYLVFDESDFNEGGDGAFRISSLGDDLCLFSADGAGDLTGYLVSVEFGAAQNGVSFGRYVVSVGAEHFVAQTSLTLGGVNAGPRVGPVVINELMYDPLPVYGTNNNTRDEFIELRNISAQAVALYDPNAPTNTWRLRGGVDFDFPRNLTLGVNEHLVVVGFDPMLRPGDLNAFRAVYGIGPEVMVVGPYAGRMDNMGEAVRLQKPDPAQTLPGPDFGLVPYVLVDEVEFANAAPWPMGANRTGKSIERTVSSAYGNDPVNWRTVSPSPGRSSSVPNPDADGDGLPDAWETAHGLDPGSDQGDDGVSGDPDGDGMTNWEEYQAGTHPNDSSSYLRVESISGGADEVRIRFQAVAGKSYAVMYREAAEGSDWQKLVDVPVQVESVEVEVIEAQATGVVQRFYRLVTPQP